MRTSCHPWHPGPHLKTDLMPGLRTGVVEKNEECSHKKHEKSQMQRIPVSFSQMKRQLRGCRAICAPCRLGGWGRATRAPSGNSLGAHCVRPQPPSVKRYFQAAKVLRIPFCVFLCLFVSFCVFCGYLDFAIRVIGATSATSLCLYIKTGPASVVLLAGPVV
jgi:hypothetical protein